MTFISHQMCMKMTKYGIKVIKRKPLTKVKCLDMKNVLFGGPTKWIQPQLARFICIFFPFKSLCGSTTLNPDNWRRQKTWTLKNVSKWLRSNAPLTYLCHISDFQAHGPLKIFSQLLGRSAVGCIYIANNILYGLETATLLLQRV